ncbi:MAG TPA: Calx-beta domain-containing protein, partial [Clostridia bacterium]|nr:Calx-beta domain-containing protein [Clostridia bacterium]
LTVLSPPVLLVDGVVLPEGSSYKPASLIAWLSRPAPTNLQASFSVELLTAQTDDFYPMSGQFSFVPRQQRASVYLTSPDSVPEPDETARLYFTSTNLLIAQPSILVMIANDDFPQASVVAPSVIEGHAGSVNANVTLKLSAKAPFPVDVMFQTSLGTATPFIDHVPRQGWVHFDALEDTKVIPIPIMGDTIYEPNETLLINLVDARNAMLPTSPVALTILNDEPLPQPQVSISRINSTSLRLKFGTVFGATYEVQSRTNLTTDPWRTLSSSIPGNGATMSITLPQPSASPTYYRLIAR